MFISLCPLLCPFNGGSSHKDIDIIGIAFNLIIIRVHRQRTREVLQANNLQNEASTLRFSPQESFQSSLGHTAPEVEIMMGVVASAKSRA
jgi:hypothetical protein